MYAEKRTLLVYYCLLVHFKADTYQYRDMYRSAFRMGIPRPRLSPSQYRTYNCKKECSRPWMRTPRSAGLSRRIMKNK